jgi:hypothetical protein
MSPADRQRLRSNAERWQHMNRRGAKGFSRATAMAAAASEARRGGCDSRLGLQLEAERRAQFEQRYIEERRRIDQELRRELREKRQRELAPVVEKLKKELSDKPGSGSSGSSSGSPSGSPKK